MQELPGYQSVLPIQAQVVEASPDGRPGRGWLGLLGCDICGIVRWLLRGWWCSLGVLSGQYQLPGPPMLTLAWVETEPWGSSPIIWTKGLRS